MHFVAVAVIFSTFLPVYLAVALQDKDLTLLESLSEDALFEDSTIFSNVGWQDLESLTLNFDDVPIRPNLDPGFALAGTCDGKNDDPLPSKIRPRDDGVCLKKDPPQDQLELPSVFPTIDPLPGMEHWEDPRLGPNQMANEYKCQLPYPYNLCCKGEIGELLDLGPPTIWVHVEECYLSMPSSLFE
jgi:hypothetical protein